MIDGPSFVTRSVGETILLGETLGRLLQPGDVVALTGDLGAGKTHFTKGIARALGVTDEVTSPTFNIMLVHEGASFPLFHFDLYRLEDAAELDDIDYYGTVESDGVSVVEWGDRFDEVIAGDVLVVTLSRVDADTRVVTVRGTGGRSMAVLDAWDDAWAGPR